jgi:hypothetical protein
MSTVNFINHKRLLIGMLVSAGFYTINVYADNVVSCDTVNGATENTAIIATTTHLNGNLSSTVTDPETGLIWKKCSEGRVWTPITIGNPPLLIGDECTGTADTFTWQTALQRAQDVNTGIGQNFAQTDWRLPNITELASIVESRCNHPAINKTIFPQTPFGGFWSSSPSAAPNGIFAWVVNFNRGNNGTSDKRSNGNHVRLVRSGQ